jgi:hypothetical protein
MGCVPAASAEVVHTAVRLLPLPLTLAPAQIVTAFAVNETVPVGATPVTVAVKLTLAPTVDGLSELTTLVVDGVFTVCDRGELLDARLPASPL